MARPRLNRNGLWARIFGKIVEKSQKNSKKIVEKCGNFRENLPKPLPPTYKSARNPKSFFRALPNPLSKP